MVGDNYIVYCFMGIDFVLNTDTATRWCPIKTMVCCLTSSEHYYGKIYDEFTNNKSTRRLICNTMSVCLDAQSKRYTR